MSSNLCSGGYPQTEFQGEQRSKTGAHLRVNYLQQDCSVRRKLLSLGRKTRQQAKKHVIYTHLLDWSGTISSDNWQSKFWVTLSQDEEAGAISYVGGIKKLRIVDQSTQSNCWACLAGKNGGMQAKRRDPDEICMLPLLTCAQFWKTWWINCQQLSYGLFLYREVEWAALPITNNFLYLHSTISLSEYFIEPQIFQHHFFEQTTQYQ